MSYRDDLAALAARHAALSTEVEQKTRELDAASALLAEAKAKAKLPVLPNIRIAAPCTADWNAMTGDDRMRHCGKCEKHVYNLSNMTRDEAEALIVAKEGKLCVRYFQRHDGTIILKDCEVGVAGRRKRRLIAAGAAALLAGGAGAAMMLRSKPQSVPCAAPDGYEEMGVVAMPDRIEVKGDIGIPEAQPPQEQLQVKMGGIGPSRAPIEDR